MRDRIGEWVGYHPLAASVGIIVAVFGTALAVAWVFGR